MPQAEEVCSRDNPGKLTQRPKSDVRLHPGAPYSYGLAPFGKRSIVIQVRGGKVKQVIKRASRG